jgi:hypothetical protein
MSESGNPKYIDRLDLAVESGYEPKRILFRNLENMSEKSVREYAYVHKIR